MRLIFSILKAAVIFVLFTVFALITGLTLGLIGLVLFLFGRKPAFQTYTVRMGRPEFGEKREMKDVTPLHPESLPSSHHS